MTTVEHNFGANWRIFVKTGLIKNFNAVVTLHPRLMVQSNVAVNSRVVGDYVYDSSEQGLW